MTKKEMVVKIAELEKQVKELTAAMIALATKPMQSGGYIFIPASIDPVHIPYAPPMQPTWPPYYPYVGDPPNQPTITCGTNVCNQQKQDTYLIN